MGGFVIYSDTTAAVLLVICLTALLTASVSTVDPYACTPKKPTPKPTELVLNCTHGANLVVTGFIRGGHVKPLPVPKKQKQPAAATDQPSECPVPDRSTACWANSINGQLLSIVQDCVWKRAICSIPVNGQLLGHPCFASPATYIFAEQFKCVHQSRIVHLCSSSDREPRLSVNPSDGETFILSKGYPEIVAPGLNCNLTITTDAEGLHFESVYMHIHPKRKRQNTCEVDYLDIRPATPVASSTDGMRFCGKEAINYTSSATSRVQFASGQEKKHYGGFVVRVTAVSSATVSTQDRRAAETGINSSEFNSVKGSASAAIPDKSRSKASDLRSKNSTKPKSERTQTNTRF